MFRVYMNKMTEGVVGQMFYTGPRLFLVSSLFWSHLGLKLLHHCLHTSLEPWRSNTAVPTPTTLASPH